jgi:TetR/AcrR family transcriptional repressor of nem operon
MRVTEEQKCENRSRILATASRLFRERGIEATSVADLMKEAGFTHGGFYNHFESKQALVTAVGETWLQKASDAALAFDVDADKAWRRYVEGYLSTVHRDDRSSCCLVSAVAGEVAHQPACVQAPLAQVNHATIDLLARHVRSLPRAAARREAAAALATMVGALTLARSVAEADPALSDEILAACRKKLLA